MRAEASPPPENRCISRRADLLTSVTPIKDVAERAFNGKVGLEFAPTGLVWQLTAPAMSCLAKLNEQSKPS